MNFRSVLLVLVAAVASGQVAGVPPTLHGETLDGKKLTMPEAGAGETVLLVLGFSRKAGDVSGPWRDRFTADFGAEPHAACYEIAFLEDAPSLMRGIVKSAMRSGTPKEQRSHFLVAITDETAWKTFMHVSDDKLPSVLLLDAEGHVKWARNGEFEAAHYKELRDIAAALLKTRQP